MILVYFLQPVMYNNVPVQCPYKAHWKSFLFETGARKNCAFPNTMNIKIENFYIVKREYILLKIKCSARKTNFFQKFHRMVGWWQSKTRYGSVLLVTAFCKHVTHKNGTELSFFFFVHILSNENFIVCVDNFFLTLVISN